MKSIIATVYLFQSNVLMAPGNTITGTSIVFFECMPLYAMVITIKAAVSFKVGIWNSYVQ